MTSVLDLYKFYKLLNNYKNDYSGLIGYHNNIKFASGAGMLLSKQLCYSLINSKNSLDYNLIDDVSIGLLLQNINISPLTRFETFKYENNVNQISKEMIKDYYHFRCKSNTDNNKTLLMMKTIINLIY